MKSALKLSQALVFCGVALGIGPGFAPTAGAATFTDANWTSVGSGVDNLVWVLTVSGTNVYAGGDFTMAGGGPANRIAKWDGSGWTPLGSGTDFRVASLAVLGSDLYAGGYFTNAGGTQVNYIAKWNGSGWAALGGGLGAVSLTAPSVNTLGVLGTDLYAGGYFMTATNTGGAVVTTFFMAKWNGSSWSPVGLGMGADAGQHPYAYAMATLGTNLYVGGGFVRATNSGGAPVTVNRIAKWDGTTWSALGSGLSDTVFALAAVGTNLYAGGGFLRATNTGGITVPVNYLAKWDGSNWSALGSGINAQVRALAVSGSDLYAGGFFSTADDGSVGEHIAKWDGSSWSALGSGMDSIVLSLTASGDDLYAGGFFGTAGVTPANHIARAYLQDLPTLSVRRSGVPPGGIKVFWPAVNTAGFALQKAGALTAPVTWVSNTASVNDDGTNKSVTIPPTNGAQFFRLRRP
jgi:hypothetical protein